ncbi:MAG: major capsid protein [Microviridae sp.]|nr:MAG: major capsid protein [Microviridae sp.]
MIGMAAADRGPMTRMRTDPIAVRRTSRPFIYRNLTSGNAGKMIPILAQPLLREDQMAGAFRFTFKMDETVEVLMNAVNVRVMAYLVPKLAFDRYDGWDTLNRSYEGVTTGHAGQAIPAWFEPYTAPADPKTNEIFWALGKHAKAGTVLNSDYIEAYNQIWNFRARNRSPHLTLRNRLDLTLAPAFWVHQAWAHVVPDFDQAIIDGEVPLNIVNNSFSVKGIGIPAANTHVPNAGVSVIESDGATVTYPYSQPIDASGSGGASVRLKVADATAIAAPQIFAEMAQNGITVSLSNIELARKTQAFANLRRQYNGHPDEYIIDLLMDGISIPDEGWKQPILLADQSTIFGMAKRWATDGASLTESVVNGGSMIDLRLRVPRCGPGGIVMIVAEIAPEQLFERQRDPYLHATQVAQLPQYLRDELDPEKVQVVENGEVDVLHSDPTGTFGYAPMNHQWAKSMPSVGGRFTRPDSESTFDEARQRIWAVETTDPVLGRDFYLVSGMHYHPFVVTDEAQDHFEIMTQGTANIVGNTVFGDLLIEATDDYEKILAEAPMDRIDKSAGMADEAEQQPA